MRRRSRSRTSARSQRAQPSNRGGRRSTIGLGASSLYQRRLRIEPLEDRSLLSAVSWDGGGDGSSWNDSLNWSGDLLPGASDDVTINAPGAVTVTLSSGSPIIHSLTVATDDSLTQSGSGALTISAASTIDGTLTISGGTATLNSATAVRLLRLNGGALSGTGDVTVTGSANWSGGTMQGAGRTIIAAGALLDMNTATHTLSRTLQNDGATTWAKGDISMNNGTIQNNATFASLASLQIPNTFVTINCTGAGGVNAFNNVGTFSAAGNEYVAFTSGVAFNNSGSVTGLNAGVELNAGGTHANGAVFSGITQLGGGTQVFGATVVVNGTMSILAPLVVDSSLAFTGSGTVKLSSTLSGAGDVTFNNKLEWAGGLMSGTGKTIVAAAGALTLTTSTHDLNRVLQNGVNATWTGGDLEMNGGTFQNNASLTVSGDVGSYGNGGSNAFNNVGTIATKNSGHVQFRVNGGSGVMFNNSGTIDGHGGAIELNAGAVFAASTQFAGLVTLGGGAQTFGAAAIVSGSLTVATPITIATSLDLTGMGTVVLASDLNGAGDVTLHGTLNWTGGAMSGAGKTIIAADGALSLTGNTHVLKRELQNYGATQWTGGGLQMIGGTFQNYGVVTSNGNLGAYGGGGTNAFNNWGTFTDLAGDVGFDFSNGSGVYFNNSGALSNQGAGFVRLNSGGAHGSGAAFSGNIILGGGIHTFAGAYNVTGVLTIATPVTADAPLSFSGSGNVQLSSELSGSADVIFHNTLEWSNAAMSGSGKTIIAPDGKLVVDNSNHYLGRVLQNDGVATWNSGSLSMISGAVQNNGLFKIANSFYASSGSGSNQFNNAGTFTALNSQTALFDIPFNNSGVMNGQTELRAGGALSPAGTVAGAVNLSGGAFAFGSTLQVSGSLTFNMVLSPPSPLTFAGSGTVILRQGLTGAADVTFDTILDWRSGTMSGAGRTIVSAAGHLILSDSFHELDRVLESNGGAEWTAGSLSMSGGVFQNNSPLTANGPLDCAGNLSAGTFNNASTFTNVGAGLVRFYVNSRGVSFNNSGTLDGGAGGIEISAGGSHSSGAIFAGVVTLNGGATSFGSTTVVSGTLGITVPLTFSGPWSVTGPGLVTISNTLTVNGDITFGATLNWAGGAQSGPGKTIITSAGSLLLSGATHTLNRPLQIDGNTVWTAGQLTLSADVQSNGSFTANSAALLKATSTLASNVFTSTGSFVKQGSGTTQFDSNVIFNALGTVDLQAGVLLLNGGGEIDASIAIASGLTLGLGGPVTYGDDTLISGPGDLQFTAGNLAFPSAHLATSGMVRFIGGTVTINESISTSRLSFQGGNVIVNAPLSFPTIVPLSGVIFNAVPSLPPSPNLEGATFNVPMVFDSPITISVAVTFNAPASIADLVLAAPVNIVGFRSNSIVTVTHSFVWQSGVILGTGRTVVAPGATLTMNSVQPFYGIGFGGTLENDGTATWTSGDLVMWNGTFVNNGTFIVSTNSGLISYDYSQLGPSTNAVINAGAFIKQGTGDLSFSHNNASVLTFNNSGLLDIRGGSVTVSTPATVSGEIDVEAGTFRLNLPLTLTGLVNIETGDLSLGPSLTVAGAGAIIGNSAGRLQLGGILGDTTNTDLFSGWGTVAWTGGSATSPRSFEVFSRDLGSRPEGFLDNFALPSLTLKGYVKLVDTSDNAAGSNPEAIYVDTLVVPVNASLDLNGLHVYARTIQIAGTIVNGQVIQILPQVSQVLVAGSGWTPEYIDQLQNAGLGDSGYAIPGNAIDQLAPLPWRNIDQIKIVFNEDVNVQAGSLTISSANLDVISITPLDFAYDAASHTATWTLAQPIGNDTFSLSLAASGPAAVTDSRGAALDGEWPSGANNYPSGNGAAGGDFHFAFNVLPGDVTRDGVVDIQDFTNFANHWLQASPTSDANGDGVVDIQETTLIANHWLETHSGGGGGGGAIALTTPVDEVENALPSSTTGAGADTIVSPSASLTSTVFWDGGGNGTSWSDPLNWSGNVLPSANDDVTIDAPGAASVTLISGAITIHSLTIGADDNLTQQSSATLTVTSTSTIAGAFALSGGTTTLNGDATFAKLTLVSGTLNGAGNVSVTGALTWSGGTMSGVGTTVINQNATVTIESGAHSLRRVLQNDGLATWKSGNLTISGGVFQNNGTFNAVPAGTSTLTAKGHFVNVGLFKNSGTGRVAFDSGSPVGLAFDNLGVMDGGTGYVELYSGGAHGPLASFANVALRGGVNTFPSTVYLAGDLWIESDITIDAPTIFTGPGVLNLSGVLSGAGDVTFATTTNWLGGGMLGTGKSWFPAGVALNIETGFGVSNNYTVTRTIIIDGTTNWTWSWLNVSGGVIQNNGVLTLHTGASFFNWGLSSSFINTGTLQLSEGSADFVNIGGQAINFSNSGTILVTGGTLTIRQLSNAVSFTNSGTVDVQGGALVVDSIFLTNDDETFDGAAAGTLSLYGDLLSDTTNADQLSGLGTVNFKGKGTAAAPQLLEAQSRDLGPVATGFLHNVALNTLSLAGTTYVKLVDQSDNATGADPEAVYVDTLIVPAGTTLDLNGLHLYTRATQIAGIILGGAVTIVPPAVSGVFVASTAWTPEFLAQLDAVGLGEGGYALAGDDPGQVESLPWQNVDQIKIAFNEDVIVQADSLAITSAALGAIMPASFSYDASTHTATWTLAQPIGNDAVTLSLASSGPAAVTDSHGVALDGEWPGDAAGFPSGNGAAGGDFQIDFSLLAGDLTHDGVVDIQDITRAANNWLQASPTADGNGDGVVDIQDITLIANNWLKQQPAA